MLTHSSSACRVVRSWLMANAVFLANILVSFCSPIQEDSVTTVFEIQISNALKDNLAQVTSGRAVSIERCKKRRGMG